MRLVRKHLRFISAFLLVNLLYELVFPTAAYALTGGPSQPEVQSFEPVGTSDMVDLFSGDFNYNIPLLDVEGYPINIAYHSGITMDQEATWVGLGWNINPGVINRNMRGLPDDFNGDTVTNNFYIKPNWTLGTNFGIGAEFFGFGRASYGLGVYYNNYRGLGFENVVNLGVSAGEDSKLGANLALTSNTGSGLTIAPSLNFSVNNLKTESGAGTGLGIGLSVGSAFNSRSGIKSNNYGISATSGGSSIGSNYSSISPGAQTYVPQISMPMTSFNGTVRVTIGTELFGAHPNTWISGYFSNQQIAQTAVSKRAFGYIYSQNKSSNDVLLDFNREKDGAYSPQNPILPVTNFTYDIYSISGQGVGGMFRPFRNDIGVVHDDFMYSGSSSASYGVEVGVGAGGHFGADVNVNTSTSSSGLWANNLYSKINFKKGTKQNPEYEASYFKLVGEKTPIDRSYLPNQDLGAVFAASLFTDGSTYHTDIEYLYSTLYTSETGNKKKIQAAALQKNSRAIRNQMITPFVASQYEECLTKGIRVLPPNSFISNNIELARYPGQKESMAPNTVVDPYRKADHTTELVVTQNDGSRYVYGIAAYNTEQKEYSFTNKTKNASKESGQTDFNTHYLDVKKGEISDGYDGFFNSKKLPGYAHSYLLTAVLSSDYVDRFNDGPTDDDLGTYTKINYTRLYDDYDWRVPYKNTKATLSEGYFSDAYDDKASIIEGKKEIWMVNSIETKNYVAIFTLGPRLDGLSSSGQPLKALTSIKLYSKAEYYSSRPATPVPIKTVNFEYDYSLCPNVENNSGGYIKVDGSITGPAGENINAAKGKLTLRKIYFTYGNSFKSKFSAYTFNYNTGSAKNPGYNMSAHDRWGNYKPHENIPGGKLYDAYFPYVLQDNVSDDYAQAWSLKEIGLPSGGKIIVDYESDDYAYVQNKRAMQMFRIAGFSNTSDGSIKAELYDDKKYTVNQFVFIQLTGTKYAEVSEDFFVREFTEGMENFYFNMLVKLAAGNTYEYVKGYADVASSGITTRNVGGQTIKYGWIELKKVDIDQGKNDLVHPVSKAAWQFARINLPHLVYPGSNNKKSGDMSAAILSGVKSLVGVFADLISLARSFNKDLRAKGYGNQVKTAESWVRLNSPDKMKKGGGCRVKKIRMTDNWRNIMNGDSQESDFDYGQEYSYTTREKVGTGYRTISSGVATYEPMIGNDENPWRRPISYSKENYLVPDDAFYVETPMGEMFFPSPSVGYSKVTVKNLQRTAVTKHATGKKVHEFYTAFDFPTIVKATPTDSRPITPKVLNALFSFSRKVSMTTSKGYMIELNDMHGKPKAEWVYAEPDAQNTSEDELKLISGVQYIYKTDADDPSHLNNSVKVVKRDGTLSDEIVGVESDLIADMRQSLNNNSSGGMQMNTDFFLAFIFPAVIPTILPSSSKDESAYRSVVMTKVVNRFGILQKTVAYSDGAKLTTENLAWDSQTGDVLLTKTQNEFKDYTYNVSYPGYWAYDNMGPAYMNTGLTFDNVTFDSNGDMVLADGKDAKNYFVEGDEVFVFGTGLKGGRYWVVKGVGANKFTIGDKKNYAPLSYKNPGAYYRIHIMRSGRKNMTTQKMFEASMMVDPVVSNTISISSSSRVLNTKVTVFSDRWNTTCGFVETAETRCDTALSQHTIASLLSYLLTTQQLTSQMSTDSQRTYQSRTAIGAYNLDTINYLVDSTCRSPRKFDVLKDSLWVNNGYLNHYDTSLNDTSYIHCVDTFVRLVDLFGDIDTSRLTMGVYQGVLGFAVDDGWDLNGTRVDVVPLKIIMPCVPDNYIQFMTQQFDKGKYLSMVKEKGGFWTQCCDSIYRTDTIVDVTATVKGFYMRKLGYKTGTCLDGCFGASLWYPDSGCIVGKTMQNVSIQVATDGEIQAVINFGSGCSYTSTVKFECPPLLRCTTDNAVCSLSQEVTYNRFQNGKRGAWRKKKEYVYLDKRVKAGTSENIRRDGYFNTFQDFWERVPGTGYKQKASLGANWVWTSEITNYDPANSQEIETVDALGRYSSVLFPLNGNKNQPIVVASNSKRRQFGSASFEEGLPNPKVYAETAPCGSAHWNFYRGHASVVLDTTYAHTGKLSFKVPANQYAFNNYSIKRYGEVNDDVYCDTCILPFFPDSGSYFISGWVKTSTTRTDASDRKASIKVMLAGSQSNTYEFFPTGSIIEGWQRIQGVVKITHNHQNIRVYLNGSTTSSVNAWFDDIRIHPFNANVKAYVYDRKSYRLTSILDENNYAAFYEYDEQGALKRVKKETENGISTISESRNSNIKRK